MTRHLWAIVLMSLLHDAGAATTLKAATSQSAAAAEASSSTTQPMHASGKKLQTPHSTSNTEQLRKDLAACQLLAEANRKECTREVYAARNEGLYRE